MLIQSLKIALKSIAANKLRSFLTVLGIVIGVLAIVVLSSIAGGATSTVTSSIENLGTNLLTINIRGVRQSPVTLDGIKSLLDDPSVGEVAPIVNGSGTAKYGTTTYTDGSVIGTTPSMMDIRNYKLNKGRFLTQPDLDNRVYVAVIGSEAATEIFGTDEPLGNQFMLNGYPFTVVGVLDAVGSSMQGSGDTMMIIPFSIAQRLYTSRGIQSFYVTARASDQVDAAQGVVTQYLNKVFDDDTTRYNIFNQTSMLETLSTATQTLQLMLTGIAAIALLVGGIGIMNIMLVSVSERTREIGIRKAIGASRGAILTQFLIEALVVSLLGGIIGIILSVLLVAVIGPLLSMNLSVPADTTVLALVFSMIIGIGFGIYPANKASRLRPIEALHYEG